MRALLAILLLSAAGPAFALDDHTRLRCAGALATAAGNASKMGSFEDAVYILDQAILVLEGGKPTLRCVEVPEAARNKKIPSLPEVTAVFKAVKPRFDPHAEHVLEVQLRVRNLRRAAESGDAEAGNKIAAETAHLNIEKKHAETLGAIAKMAVSDPKKARRALDALKDHP